MREENIYYNRSK